MTEIKSYDDLNEYGEESLKRLALTLIHQNEEDEKEKERLKVDNEFLKAKLEQMDERLKLLTEQIAISNRRRFVRSSEKDDVNTDGQIAFCEDKDGNIIYFNEAEAVLDYYGDPEEIEEEENNTNKAEKRGKKKAGDALPGAF